MTTKIIRHHGVDVRATYTPGHGVPLVLCNGWGANLEAFDPLLTHLSNRAQLRFDVPGIGGSALPRVPLRMPQLAALVEQLWQHFDITEVDVLGYSWGGALAQELARRNPEAVRKLALMATSPGHIMVPAWPTIALAFANYRWLSVLAKPSQLFSPELLCRVGPRLFGGEVLRRNPQALLANLALLREPSVAAMLWQLAALAGWSSLPWLSQLRQPTLILAGRQDAVINPLNARILHRLIKDSRLRWINGGHLFPVLDAPQLTAQHLAGFFDEHANVVTIRSRRKQVARRAG